MDFQEENYVETKVANEGKDKTVAWLLWFFLGGIGAHRFYFKKTGSAVAMLLVTFTISILLLGIPTIVWAIYDAFQINKWIEEDNKAIRSQVKQEVAQRKSSSVTVQTEQEVTELKKQVTELQNQKESEEV